MNHKAALNQYRNINTESAIEQASPHRLVQMLMEGALQRMAEARGALQRKAIAGKGEARVKATAEKGEAIGKAISIIGGLRDSLRHEVQSDLPQKLDSLYLYMTTKLLEVNVNNDVASLDEIIKLMKTLKEGWDGIENRTRY